MEVPPPQILESYFEEYCSSTKAYKTQEGLDEFFRKLVKFLQEVA